LSANGKPIAAVSQHAAAVRGSWDGVPFARINESGGHSVRATLADVGEGYAADYDKTGNVRGKAVLVRCGQPWPVYQILEAAHRGAAALLIYDYPQAPANATKQGRWVSTRKY
jgi:hypothetical protein